MTRWIVFTIAFVIAGEAAAQEPEDACGAAGLQGLVGQSGEIARLLAFEDRVLRVFAPGDVVTADFRIERLNINTDETDLIESVACG